MDNPTEADLRQRGFDRQFGALAITPALDLDGAVSGATRPDVLSLTSHLQIVNAELFAF